MKCILTAVVAAFSIVPSLACADEWDGVIIARKKFPPLERSWNFSNAAEILKFGGMESRHDGPVFIFSLDTGVPAVFNHFHSGLDGSTFLFGTVGQERGEKVLKVIQDQNPLRVTTRVRLTQALVKSRTDQFCHYFFSTAYDIDVQPTGLLQEGIPYGPGLHVKEKIDIEKCQALENEINGNPDFKELL